jgi:hypothetical protein
VPCSRARAPRPPPRVRPSNASFLAPPPPLRPQPPAAPDAEAPPATTPPAAAAGPEYFIAVRGGQFTNGCDAFKVAGWNAWEVVDAAAGAPATYGASIPPGMTGPQLVREQLAAGKKAGLNVMRTWVHTVNPQYALQTVRRGLPV